MFGISEGEQPLNVGDRVLVAGQRRGYVRYSGQTKFAPGTVKPRLWRPDRTSRDQDWDKVAFHNVRWECLHYKLSCTCVCILALYWFQSRSISSSV